MQHLKFYLEKIFKILVYSKGQQTMPQIQPLLLVSLEHSYTHLFIYLSSKAEFGSYHSDPIIY